MAQELEEAASSEYFLAILAVGMDRCFINAGLILTRGLQGLGRK